MTYGRNDRRCKMLSTLLSGIECFCNHSQRLQTILEGTKRCFDDINTRGKNETGPLVSLEVLHEAVEEILSSADKLPGIVVLGQNEYCKSQMVNELFQRTIFPTFYPNDIERRYRTVRFKYGENLCINLELPDEYSLAENLEAYKSPWNTIPRKDLEISENEEPDSAVGTAVLEVSFNHPLLRCGCTLVVAASNVLFEDELKRCMENISPILIYAFHTESFTTKEIQDLELLREITNFQPVCFVCVPDPEMTPQKVEGDPLYCGVVHSPTLKTGKRSSQSCEHNNNTITENVLENGESIKSNLCADTNVQSGNQQSSETKHALDNFMKCAKCDKDKMNAFYLSTSSSEPESSLPTVSSPSDRMGKAFVTTVPPNNCHTIFADLCKVGYLTETPGVRKFSQKKVENYFQVDSILVTDLHQFQQSFTTFSEQTMQRYLVNAVTVLNNTHKRCLDTFIICAFDMTREVLITPKKIQFAHDKEKELFKSLMKIATEKGDEIKQMIECTVADRKAHLIQKAHDYEFVGVELSEAGEILTHRGLKICTEQIQELVLGELNQEIAGKLVNSVDIMRDSYTGTLTRCLESLEKVERENPGNSTTTEALKQILNAAYQVEITVRSSSSIINILLQGMKQLVQAMPWSHSPKIDNEWKTKVAADMLANLSAARLAKNITSQIKDRLKKPHDAFLSALEQLDTKHVRRLVKIEEERLKLQKVHAPRVAKVALESTSLKDLILYGMPQMGKEISRGQYGVVHSCDKWAGHSPCAIKSVVPLDDKHLNDLALEFFYTKNIPDHDRVVRLHGSIIDYTYGGGTTPAVLLIMDRLQRDLHTAIEQRLDWVSLLQVSVDVVEGIRFLHSRGLVHRDIKLKNVLLDKEDRGKITDLGFCKPEAMISGSIVGTPLHMAPELFTGQYDSSVDVYAFGILFWHVCAGNVRKPQNFEQFANKDQLSANLKKGLRPEYLPVFDDECWELMSKCWENKPLERPVLGDVQQRLIKIYERYRNKPGGPKTAKDS